MLAGEGVVAIWNGIAPEGRAEFYAWHLHEHMPERVGIPGFRRGRRYIAADGATAPEFFTLYETDSLQVLQGQDYANRLNAPTPWTKSATSHFEDTFRSLARVVASRGPGSGGALLTLRFDVDDLDALAPDLLACADAPRICGVHLCAADRAASDVRTAESRGRSDIRTPPSQFLLIEATDPEAFADLVPEGLLLASGASQVTRGIYRLEYTRGKTAWSA
jgi:hypothetical protein